MKKLLLLIAFVCLTVTAQAQSPLATIANSMQPGTWAELQTTNESVLLNPGSSGASTIIPYAMTMAYDSIRKQVHFIGGDHAGGTDPATGFNHVRYDLASNTWTRLGHPSWYSPSPYNDAHGYDLLAINSAGRKLYRLPYNSNIVQVFSLDSDDTTNAANWSVLPVAPEGNYVLDSMEWSPERNSLIVFFSSGSVWEFKEATQTWVGLSYDPYLASTWNWIVRSSTSGELIVASRTNRIWKMSTAGIFTRLPDIPETYRSYNGYGYNGLWTSDPATGKYLLMTDPMNETGRNVYEYDSATDAYISKTPPPDKHLQGNFIAAPISDYGVTMWAWAVGGAGGSTGVYLYKNGASQTQTNQPPTVSAGPDQTIAGAFTATLPLVGSATDTPGQTLTYQWSLISGPGTVAIVAPMAAVTSAVVHTAGTFVFRLTVSDGQAAASDDVVIIVNDPIASTGPPNAFAVKCAQPGVLSCYSFDKQSDLLYGYSTNSQPCVNDPFIQPRYNITPLKASGEGNTVATTQNNQCVYPVVDTSMPHSGTGSLKFTVPSTSSDNTSGNFTAAFKRNADGSFYVAGPGQTVYMQFYQRMDSNFLNTNYAPGGGWKQMIYYGNPPQGSNSSGIEVTHVNGYLRGVPQMYGQQGADDYGIQDVRGCYYNFNGLRTYPEPPCIRFKPDTWIETTTRVDMGSVSCYGGVGGPGDTRVRMWINSELSIDNPKACVRYNAGDGDGLGSFVITPFQTGKDASQVTPIAYTWYDDVIISTQPIAMTASTTPPPDPCTVDPLRITGVKWPSAQTGSRSITYNSGTKKVVSVLFKWPGTLTVTDDRACSVTVTK